MANPPAFETLAVHAGQEPDPASGAVMEPIVLATTFAQPEPGKPLRFDYSRSGIPLVVDNTFASPALQRPLALGATVALHSTTKYVNGHSDVVGGALVTGDPELAKRLAFLQNAIGAVPSPMDCYLVLRGIKTLAVRMQRHGETAAELARRLEGAAGVRRVHYPGLPSHPQHALCRRQMPSGGGMISVELDGDLDHAPRLLGALRIFTLAESLGV